MNKKWIDKGKCIKNFSSHLSIFTKSYVNIRRSPTIKRWIESKVEYNKQRILIYYSYQKGYNCWIIKKVRIIFKASKKLNIFYQERYL